MIKLEPYQITAEQIAKDLHALSILISGMPDTSENKQATATYIRVIAKNSLSLSNQLNKEADKIHRVIPQEVPVLATKGQHN